MVGDTPNLAEVFHQASHVLGGIARRAAGSERAAYLGRASLPLVVIQLIGARTLGQPIDPVECAEPFVDYPGCRHRHREAGVGGHLDQDLLDLGACQAVIQPDLGVQRQLLAGADRGEHRDHNQAAIPA